jgi:hypothetical protein
MDSILNIDVSCFRDYNTPDNPRSINLLTWLQSSKFADKVEQIRTYQDKAIRDSIKATLPAITPSGVFTYRAATNLVRHSGFIQFDIDAKDNPHVSNYTNLKAELKKVPNIAYCGLSVSGTGYWGLVPIAYPEKHKEHFEFMYRFFEDHHLIIDKSCKDVTRLRGYSHDPEAYFNHNAKLLTACHTEPVKRYIKPISSHTDNNDTLTVEAIIKAIEAHSIDITSGYGVWFAIGCDLASTFGGVGEGYFHTISQYHPEYNQQRADTQYTACLRFVRGKASSLGALVNAAKDHGITIPRKSAEAIHPTDQRILFRDGKRLEVLKDGSLIEVTPVGYPALWDLKYAAQ